MYLMKGTNVGSLKLSSFVHFLRASFLGGETGGFAQKFTSQTKFLAKIKVSPNFVGKPWTLLGWTICQIILLISPTNCNIHQFPKVRLSGTLPQNRGFGLCQNLGFGAV